MKGDVEKAKARESEDQKLPGRNSEFWSIPQRHSKETYKIASFLMGTTPVIMNVKAIK